MRIVVVKFKGTEREYEFLTNLSLIVGGQYRAVADGITEYVSPITVLGYRKKQNFSGKLRVITSAICEKAPSLIDDGIAKVIFNEAKRTTVVIWKDGVKTFLKCAEDDKWDEEKALALCYMKRHFYNRGAFNKVLQKYCGNSGMAAE